MPDAEPLIDPAILDLLEEREVDDGWSGQVWRQVFQGSPPLRPNTRGSRWNPSGVDALYTSATEAGAAAEIDHLIKQQPIPITTPRVSYCLQVELSRVVDLREWGDLESLGITFNGYDDAGTRCAEVGRATAWLGCGGLLVPSARSAAWNLVIFVNAADPDDTWEVVVDP